jgi:hypothetical protein
MRPFGRCIYLRLALGLSRPTDKFTLKYGNAIDDATDGKRVTEDTLICGSSTTELLANTRRVFEACRQAGITLNLQKVLWDLPGAFVIKKSWE